MSEDLDALAESARNRGLKLIRSRVRTPGKRAFGKVGLVDAAGKPVLGIDGKKVTAKPEEVEAYLRGLGASDWTKSLGVDEPPRKRAVIGRTDSESTIKPRPRPVRAAKREPVPEPKPSLAVRPAVAADAAALVDLIRLLEFDADRAGVRKRLTELIASGEAPLVATIGKEVVGLCGIHRMTVVHRPKPVGRITILVLAEPSRGEGAGRKLIEAAEARLRKNGCGLIEITGSDHLTAAHAFYRHLGYERTSMRFSKMID